MKLVLRSLAVLTCSLPSVAFQNPALPAGASQPKSTQSPAVSISPGRSKSSSRGPQPLMFVASNDACAASTAISGPGPHSFDNTSATTDGCPNCQPCGSIQRDVWFNWTAGATASFTVSLCGGGATIDSVVAAYNGSSCPPAPAIACNDDFCGTISEASFSATVGNVIKLQIGSWSTSPGGPGTFTLTTAIPPANDGCATPTVISGPGPHAFDNTAATAGAEGQAEGLCFASATAAIGRDVWFRWTAGSTGLAQLTTCSQTSVDSKIAVYTTSTCPVSASIGCSDDACGLQSAVCFEVKGGQTYMIQMGVFPTAAGGTGTFSIPISPPPLVGQLDDGTSENLLGFGPGGELVWMQRFGDLGSTSVSSIQVTWGSAAFPGSSPGNGSASKIAIWDDPTEDGDPSDAVLIQVVNTTVSNVDTDTFVTVPITPVVVNKRFFLGAGLAHSSGQFVAPMDVSCPIAGRAWFFGNDNATPADYSNVQNNVFPPASFSLSGFPALVMVRGGSIPLAGITFCEPGINGVIPCPCGNAPSGPGRGCNNSANTGGTTLADAGVASLSADTLVFTTTGETFRAMSVVMQGSTELLSGVPFGDGVRCLDEVSRLYTKTASGGSITAPQGGDPSVSARCAALGQPIPAGQTRYYMVFYRDRATFACPSPAFATFNTSGGKRVAWIL